MNNYQNQRQSDPPLPKLKNHQVANMIHTFGNDEALTRMKLGQMLEDMYNAKTFTKKAKIQAEMRKLIKDLPNRE